MLSFHVFKFIIFNGKFTVVLATFIGFLCVIPAGVSQNLFSESESVVEESKNKDLKDRITNYKKIPINRSVSKISINKIKNIQKDGKFALRLPGDNRSFICEAQYVESIDEENYQWSGKILDETNKTIGDIMINCVESALFGEINVEDRIFVIEDFGKSSTSNSRNTYLIEKNSEMFAEAICGVTGDNKTSEKPRLRPEALPELRNICTRNVRVLVLFTTAANNAANATQAATNFINQSNQALRNSGITAEQLTFQLAAAQLFNGVDDQIARSNPGGPFSPAQLTAEWILNDLNNNAQVENLRANTFDADLVVLLINNPTMTGELAGWANLHNLNDRTRAHSIVQILEGARFTFTHEMAHNFGCKHDNDNATTNGLTTFARGKGWTQSGTNRRTIMAIAAANERILHFSSPGINFNNVSTGDTDRDNARQLREQALKISNYEIGSDPLQTIIEGPSTIYNASENYTWCASNCNQTVNSYLWSWSSDGFTYYNLGSNSCLTASGSVFNSSATTIFIRVIAYYAGGQNTTTILPVTNNQGNPYFRETEILELASSSPSSLRAMYSVSPNPTKDWVRLKISTQKATKLRINVYNELGQLEPAFSKEQEFPKGVNDMLIDLSLISKGVKYISIDDGTRVETLPVILSN